MSELETIAVNRAYALVSACHYQPPGPLRAHHAIEVSITNFGKTPAFDFSVIWRANISVAIRDCARAELSQAPGMWDGRTTPTALAPGDKEMFDVPLHGFDALPPHLLGLIPGAPPIFEAQGVARYRDTFGLERKSEFWIYLCREGPDYLRAKRFGEGNDAN